MKNDSDHRLTTSQSPRRLLSNFYRSTLVQGFLKTDRHNLAKLIKPEWSVLDIGCGSSPPVLGVVTPRRYVGVDAFKGSLEILGRNDVLRNIEDVQLVCSDVRRLNFKDREFDAVLLVDLIEHLTKEDGAALLRQAQNWAREVVYVSTPNGFLRQDPYLGNSYQEHLSGWTTDELRSHGFPRVRGGGGPKVLRRDEMQPDQWSHAEASSIRFRPRILWSTVSAILQPVTYWMPKKAYQLYAISDKRH